MRIFTNFMLLNEWDDVMLNKVKCKGMIVKNACIALPKFLLKQAFVLSLLHLLVPK